jgi:outer membrane receptor for ferrienterochelin and colicins
MLAPFSIVLSILLTPGQETRGVVRVEVRSAAGPVAGARVTAGRAAATTDTGGIAVLTLLPGAHDLAVVKDAFVPVTVAVDVVGGQTRAVIVDLAAEPTVEEDVTVVASTRTGGRIDDQPMRVEVLSRDEIEEKMLMTPGDIVMMLNEMGGMRVQATSPSLGAASVRIQGMRGRYTRFLSDGLPLFGEQPGGLGLLQIPPMDLGQVEVIKGVASALYGAGAMGGVVNLMSRRPGAEPEREALINRSTRGATDAVLWLAAPFAPRWSGTLLAGGHWQDQTDVDGDGWSDLPGYSRAVVRPRLFWDDGKGRSFFATAGATWEDRRGGTAQGAVLGATGLPFREALETARFDAGALGQTIVRGRYVVTARMAVAHQRHGHEFGGTLERDRHDTAFAEVAVRGTANRHTWVGGIAFDRDAYSPRDLPQFAYTFTAPGVFAQDDVAIAPWLSISLSGRADFHSEYGTFFSPRVSALARSGGWTSRISAGRGFFAATPLVEETEAAGLSRLTIPRPLRAERGSSASIDLTRTEGPASFTATVFASRISSPVHVDRSPQFVLRNLDEPTTNTGVELLGTLRQSPFALTTTYTYVRARELGADVPLTPRHSAGLVAMLESEDHGRLGLELYYTGTQLLESNPYRSRSAPYAIVGFLAERRFGRLRVFVNAENLTGTRQTRFDPLLRPARAPDGRWTVDAWAPLEGRVVNGGVRLQF